MSNKDKQLIEQAWATDPICWCDVDALIEKAESAEAKEKLRVIRNHKYQMERYS